MKNWNQLMAAALVPLVVALAVVPALGQETDWFDEPLVELDWRLDDLGNLDDILTYNVGPGLFWAEDHCEDEEDCQVRVIVEDGERLVIVNGDTVRGDRTAIPGAGAFAYRFGPGKFKGFSHGPHHDFHREIRHHRMDPEVRKMEREARDLARRARTTEGAERAELERELDTKLNEIFDRKLEHQNESVKKAEERVERLKEQTAMRESARDDIIRNRKEELLGKERYLEW